MCSIFFCSEVFFYFFDFGVALDFIAYLHYCLIVFGTMLSAHAAFEQNSVLTSIFFLFYQWSLMVLQGSIAILMSWTRFETL